MKKKKLTVIATGFALLLTVGAMQNASAGNITIKEDISSWVATQKNVTKTSNTALLSMAPKVVGSPDYLRLIGSHPWGNPDYTPQLIVREGSSGSTNYFDARNAYKNGEIRLNLNPRDFNFPFAVNVPINYY